MSYMLFVSLLQPSGWLERTPNAQEIVGPKSPIRKLPSSYG